MIRILGKRQSINVRKVLWACDEMALPYAREDWGSGTRPTSDPLFLGINPKALVPVLIDGDAIVTESNTIVRYLAAKHHRADLLPTEPLARARVEEMMDWQATEFNSAWRVAFGALVRKNSNAGTPDQITRSIADWQAMLDLLERHLSGGNPYVCGDTFTIADIVIGLSVNRWFQAPVPRRDTPAVAAYFDRLKLRPAAKPYLGGETD